MLVTATESNFAAGDRSVGLGPNRGGSLLSQTSPVPIIRLPGITLANFASRHVEQWFHISRAKLCYQSQLLPPSQVAITLVYRHSHMPIQHDRALLSGECRRPALRRKGA